jgi:hypothetical protein
MIDVSSGLVLTAKTVFTNLFFSSSLKFLTFFRTGAHKIHDGFAHIRNYLLARGVETAVIKDNVIKITALSKPSVLDKAKLCNMAISYIW